MPCRCHPLHLVVASPPRRQDQRQPSSEAFLLVLLVPCTSTSQFGFCHFTSCVKMKKDTGSQKRDQIFGRVLDACTVQSANPLLLNLAGSSKVAVGVVLYGVAEIYITCTLNVCQLLRST